mmetsp:Transcript_16393/g.40322  ORF Transcript_16393/g.40322 Transcript_16393/m.40322 type:complete len:245 (+) Transcript_16393:1250-1984(+)
MPHGSVVGGAAVREAVHGAADGVHPLQAVLGVPRDCMEGSWDGGGGGAAPQPRHVCAPRRQFIAAPVATGTSVASAAAAAPAFTGEGATAPVYAAAAAARSATPHRATAARAAATEASVYVVAVVVAAAGAAALPCRSHHCRHRRRGFERAHISRPKEPAARQVVLVHLGAVDNAYASPAPASAAASSSAHEGPASEHLAPHPAGAGQDQTQFGHGAHGGGAKECPHTRLARRCHYGHLLTVYP